MTEIGTIVISGYSKLRFTKFFAKLSDFFAQFSDFLSFRVATLITQYRYLFCVCITQLQVNLYI